MTRNESRSFKSVSRSELEAVGAVFFDIDDTFSGGGGQHRILGEPYQSLWRLSDAGVHVIPVTGRPAGWCDMIARMWPVSAVVGENGAFYSYLDDSKKPHRLVKKYLEGAAVRRQNALKLKRLQKSVQSRFPGVRMASDQAFREFDLAIDYCEDVSPWKDAKVERLLQFCRDKGAIAKLSSIHVNTWYGRYDKWSCVRRVMSQLFRIDPYEDSKKVVYIGDSPNDEPFFERLPFTIGVANVRKFLDRMEFGPTYITEAEAGLGFTEFAERLLEAKT